jgi:hypothetical protein
MVEVVTVSMVGGTISPRSDSARDVQGLGPPPSLANARCLLHRKEKLCLDNAFALIEATGWSYLAAGSFVRRKLDRVFLYRHAFSARAIRGS